MTKFIPASKIHNKLLRTYQVKVNTQQELLVFVKKRLPVELATQAKYCMLSDTTLIIFVDNAAWASQIRFYANDLLRELQEEKQYAAVGKVQCRLLTHHQDNLVAKRKPNLPAATMIRHIGQVRAEHRDVLSQALASLAVTLAAKSK